MYLRIFSTLLPVALLSACDVGEETSGAPPGAVEDTIFCRTGGAEKMERDCLVEKSGEGDSAVLTIRHPGGGFRRLQIVTDGRGVVAADGSEETTVVMTGDKQAEVAIAGDRYLLPAVAVSAKN